MQVNILKSAMKSGAVLGVLFSINFLLSIPTNNTLAGIIKCLVVGAIILALYRLSTDFRDKECGGYITYGKSFSFILFSFFYAALISSMVKFVYFQFINPDHLNNLYNELNNLYNEAMLLMEKMKFPIDSSFEDSLSSLLKPASFSLQYIWVNMLGGTFVGLIMAAFIKKEKNIFEEQ